MTTSSPGPSSAPTAAQAAPATSKAAVVKLDQVGTEVLGSARRVVITKDNTTIVDGNGDVAEVKAPGGIKEYEILDVKYL